MTPQEREVINGIFERLKPAATQHRDPEAERHIAEIIKTQPYAPYVMAQSLYVQEQALMNMHQQMEQLQAQVQQMQQAQAQQQQQSGGFLSGLFGGGARPQPQPQHQPMAQQAGPWGGQPQGGMPMQQGFGQPAQAGPWGAAAAQPRQGMGFLGTALTAAAGVAGGMVVGNMLMNAFSGSGAGAQQNSGLEPVNSTAAAPQAEPASAQDYAAYDDGGGYDSGGDSYDA